MLNTGLGQTTSSSMSVVGSEFASQFSSAQFSSIPDTEARCSSVVRAFAHGAMGRRIDPSWGEPIELFLVPASAPRLV